MAALSAASSASAASEVEAYWRNPLHRMIPIIEDTLKTNTNKGHQIGLFEIPYEIIERGTEPGQGRILLSDLLDLICSQLSYKPKVLIVACRTTGEKKRMPGTPHVFDRSERFIDDENSYILIEGHGTERINEVTKKPEPFTYDKADLYFRAELGDQCKKKEWPEEYDSFMSSVTMLEYKEYEQTVTNPFIYIHELRITKRYMTTKMEFSEGGVLGRKTTIARTLKRMRERARHPGLTRNASVGQPSTPHGIPTSNSTPNSMSNSTPNSMPNSPKPMPNPKRSNRTTKLKTPKPTGKEHRRFRLILGTYKGGTVKRKPRKKSKTRRRS
jgi:hypothetical protein